jgi:hypothetical protein
MIGRYDGVDMGTFEWYKPSIGGGVKSLILLTYLWAGESPPLGTKTAIFCDFLRESAMDD